MPPVKFSRALYDFEAYLDVEKNLAERTRKAYVYDLERFMDDWIERHRANPTLDKIMPDDIQRYLERLRMDRNYKSSTLSRTISSIRVFFDFCLMRKLLRDNPAAQIHTPKMQKKLPIFLLESELKRLLEVPAKKKAALSPTAKQRGDYKTLAARDHAILVTFGFTGLRLFELVGLNIADVVFEHETIRVLGKGSRERIVPMNQVVVKVLREWLGVRQPASPQEPAIFLNRFGGRISTRGVEKIVEKCVKAAGISKDKVSPHKLRHTFATLLHLNGVDIVEIQALLGHASINTTQIYTHVSSKRLQGAVKKLESI
ncbi:MAG TPA: tyrosine recombinase XerC [Sumerlaeia bacterium]|nr:tyrosine recombinase XerC [Sumerlaeia bacterium]